MTGDKIYGPVMKNGVWRKRINELHYGEGVILSEIKMARTRQVGHAQRTTEESIFHDRTGGKRPKRRPRKMWLGGRPRHEKTWWTRVAKDRRKWGGGNCERSPSLGVERPKTMIG